MADIDPKFKGWASNYHQEVETDAGKQKAFMIAVRNGQLGSAKYIFRLYPELIQSKQYLDVAVNIRHTDERLELCEFLLTDVKITPSRNALRTVAKSKDLNLIKLFVDKHEKSLNFFEKIVFNSLLNSTSIEVVEYLLNECPRNLNLVIQNAYQTGDIPLIDMLLSLGVGVVSNRIRDVIFHGHLAVLEHFDSKNVNWWSNLNQDPCSMAVECKQLPILKYLVSRKFDAQNAFIHAVSSKYTDAIDYLYSEIPDKEC